MAQAVPINTQHDDMIHDAQFDYYGKRLATCSSDRTIKIFDVAADGTATKVSELKRHEGPVWQVAWAHPRFGALLASCSYDRRVIIWKEEAQNNWVPVHEYTDLTLSVNSVAWAPEEHGLALAAASADGNVSILTWRGDDRWEAERFMAHRAGVNAVSWAPALQPGSLLASTVALGAGVQGPVAPRRIATAGCDNVVKIWVQSPEVGAGWTQQAALEEHKDWVRDVAWAPNIGLAYATLASCSQDCTVVVWTQENVPNGAWTKKALPKFADVVWRVSWSITGNILAVSGGDNKVTLWKESVEGEWKCVSTMDEPAEQAPQPTQ